MTNANDHRPYRQMDGTPQSQPQKWVSVATTRTVSHALGTARLPRHARSDQQGDDRAGRVEGLVRLKEVQKD